MSTQNSMPNGRVPKAVLNQWKNRQTRGDVTKLTEVTGYSKPTIIRALKHGLASSELVLDISRYFSKKANEMTQLEERALKLLNQSS